ncbi:MAG: CCA tRNA nucleotidyltransferase [Candidatus Ornithospirochaeta sp.]
MIVPETLKELASVFAQNGFSLYLVGGAVRDYLMGQDGHDYDFTTDATPEEVKKMFRRTIDTGIKHGTVTVLHKGGSYEITTFRTEGDYSDSRHPDSVTFVRSLEEDLKRRDFTINAFAVKVEDGEIIDMHGGFEDLEKKTIRAIGRAEERFKEDALRMMRAARFSAKLGFNIEENTLSAMGLLKDNIRNVSAERIREEFFRLIDSPFPRMGLDALDKSGLLEILFPELYATKEIQGEGYHSENLYEHHILALEAARDEGACLEVKIASLFHDIGKVEARREKDGKVTYYSHEIIGKKMASAIMTRLKASNKEKEMTSLLIQEHMVQYSPSWSDGAVRRMIIRIGEENLPSFFALRRCDRKATLALPESSDDKALEERVEKILSSSPAMTIKDLKIGGRELSGIMEKGPKMGKVLSALLEEVIDDPSLNTEEKLLEEAKRIASEL